MFVVIWRRLYSRSVDKYLICKSYNKSIMSALQYLREFINGRLTVAVDEIFEVFEKTLLQYEEEIGRQRRLLDIVWKPQVKLHRIATPDELKSLLRFRTGWEVMPTRVCRELPQQHVCKEEEDVVADQQLCDQERNSSLDQEDPEPPEIKEEQEELCSIQEGEQLGLKQETDPFMLTPTYEDSDHSEPEPDSDQQLLFHSSPVAESQDQRGNQHVDSGSTSHSSNVDNFPMSQTDSDPTTGNKSFKCGTCGKDFIYKANLIVHLRIHTGEKPYSCKICGTSFTRSDVLSRHMRIHTGEKPYSCKTCRKRFTHSQHLLVHIRIHTGEKPYVCSTCGKGFKQRSELTIHFRVHTGEKPYECNVCGKRFRQKSIIKKHMRTHAGEN